MIWKRLKIFPTALASVNSSRRAFTSISVEGLTARTRHAVHLSTDVEMATRVGARHGSPLVLVVDAARMYEDGHTFSCSDNGVWLTAVVPPIYLSQLKHAERWQK